MPTAADYLSQMQQDTAAAPSMPAAPPAAQMTPAAPSTDAAAGYLGQMQQDLIDRQGPPKPQGSDISQNFIHPVANGMFPFGLADKMRAATAATKESFSGGLDWRDAYNQALSQYQASTKQQEQEHPIETAVGKAVGSVPPLLLGGEAINAGLRSAGPVGQFLAGETAAPTVARAANGAFRTLTTGERITNAVLPYASRAALMAREGAQAGAYGAASNPEGDIAKSAGIGALVGGGAGLLVPPVVAGLGQLASIPGRVLHSTPEWVKTLLAAGGGAAGGMAAHGGGAGMASMFANPYIAAAAGTAASAKFLASHPELRDLVTRMGIMGYAAAQSPAAQAPQ